MNYQSEGIWHAHVFLDASLQLPLKHKFKKYNKLIPKTTKGSYTFEERPPRMIVKRFGCTTKNHSVKGSLKNHIFLTF